MAATVIVRGIPEAQAKINQVAKDLHGEPLRKAMQDATLVVTRTAKEYSPVDTGRLMSSITPAIVTRDTVVQGIVGSNVFYAPYQEERGRDVGPTGKGRRYLYRALTQNAEKIYKILADAVGRIVEK